MFKHMLLLFSLLYIFSIALYADAACKEKNTTHKIFTKEYPHHVSIEKEHFDNGCGIKKDTISIFQNAKKVEILSGFYDVKLRSDDEVDKNGNRKLIFTVYGGGNGTDYHSFIVVEANMTKSMQVNGYDIKIEDVNDDSKKEIILPKSIFFCISNQFCSHASSLSIELILKFENHKLMIDKKLMEQRSTSIQACSTDVKIEKQNLTFIHKTCAEKNLKILGYSLYTSDIEKFKNTLKYFKFNTEVTKRKFQRAVLDELKKLEFITEDDIQKKSVFIENL